jgi:hypothetical protein
LSVHSSVTSRATYVLPARVAVPTAARNTEPAVIGLGLLVSVASVDGNVPPSVGRHHATAHVTST